MIDKILSICVPTFEGADFLDDLLLSLCESMELCESEEFEIIVSNNNHDDDITRQTANIVSRYAASIPVKMIDNPHKSLRLDGNLYNLLNSATGKFVWFMCDDDAITKNALQKIVRVIKDIDDRCPLCFVNYFACDDKLNIIDDDDRSDITITGRVKNGNEFLKFTDLQFGLVSSIIVDRKEALKCNLNEYLGTDSLHIPLVLQLANQYGGYIERERLVLMRDNNARWGAGADQVIIISRLFGLFGIMHKLDYSIQTIKWVQNYFFNLDLQNYNSLPFAWYV